MKKVLIASSLLMASVNAYSQTSIFGKPNYYGKGCKGGTATVATTAETIDISFGDYNLTIGGSTGILTAGTDCTIDIPLTIPLGYSAVVDKVEYYGFGIVPTNGKLTFSADYYFDLVRGLTTRETIRGPFNDSFTISDVVSGESRISTKCGSNPYLRIRSQVVLTTNQNDEDAFMSMDRLSAKGFIKYHYRLTPCRMN